VYLVTPFLPHSDDIGVVRMCVCMHADIAISWRHSLTNYAAVILSTGLTPKTRSPIWNGSKLSTKRLVVTCAHRLSIRLYTRKGQRIFSSSLLMSSVSHRLGWILALHRPPRSRKRPGRKFCDQRIGSMSVYRCDLLEPGEYVLLATWFCFGPLIPVYFSHFTGHKAGIVSQ
jgi:hypothetical protein